MIISKLEEDRIEQFIDYCRNYGYEHDDSYIGEDDLNTRDFIPDEGNPTYIVTDETSRIVGAASLMINEFQNYNKCRIRILHCISGDKEVYLKMINSLLSHVVVDNIYLFLPEDKNNIGEILKECGFKIQRYSYVLVKKDCEYKKPVFPKGFYLKPYRINTDDDIWCNIINTCFATLAGHMDMKSDLLYKYLISENYLEGGLMILWNTVMPIGLLHVAKQNGGSKVMASIEQIAIIPEYQGKGLGRNLLRAGIDFGKRNGLSDTSLSVNGENSKAANLYISEGFIKEVALVCYNKKLLSNKDSN
jgi:mycothiol synthase